MTKELTDLKREIEKIKERNTRVEEDKAWETSWTRKVFIIVSTYIVVVIFMMIMQEDKPFLKALVPVVGYIVSSVSYDAVRAWWLKRI